MRTIEIMDFPGSPPNSPVHAFGENSSLLLASVSPSV